MASWIDEYDNVAEFYFWEPQHLGRVSAKSGKNFPVILGELRRKEVPLNHLLNYFLHLAPLAMTGRVYGALMGAAPPTQPVLRGRSDWEAVSFCQPDVWMTHRDGEAFIELKLASKLPYVQLFRYAALLAKQAPGRDASLLLLSPTGRFPEADLFEQRRFEGMLEVPGELLSKLGSAAIGPAEVLDAASKMQISRATFADLTAALDVEMAQLSVSSEGGETLGKLLSGLREAFARVQ